METEIITCWKYGWHHGPTYNVTRDEWNCVDHYENCDCPLLKADPDIAGKGASRPYAVHQLMYPILT
jgi:hypothetical protein